MHVTELDYVFDLPGLRAMCIWDEVPENQPPRDGRDANEADIEVAIELPRESTCVWCTW
jgi:hypothetical protein